MTEYIYFYIIELSLLLFVNLRLKDNLVFLIAVAVSILFAGFRHMVGYDYLNYVSFYIIPETMVNIEPLFRLSIYLFRLFTEDYHFFFFFCSMITFVFIVLGIKKIIPQYQNYAYILFLLIPSLFLVSFSIIRFSLAMSIFFYGLICYLKEGDKKKFLFFALLSTGFHYTMLIIYIFILLTMKLLRKKYSFSFYLLLLCSAFILYYYEISSLILSKILFGKYDYYETSFGDATNLKMFAIFIISLFFIIENNYLSNTPEKNFILNVVFFNNAFAMAFNDFPHVTRIGYIFTLFQIILIPIIFSSQENNKISKGRLYWKYSSFFFLIIYYILMPIMILRSDILSQIDGLKFTPYSNYLLLQ